ncbi:MAG: YjjG family noncanonical pyrimidine nucleotidase [Clostridia bacterium]|nr:YjjG family noncanonical pyrimidine nucleotidase [Clostridia bacterium]
MKYTTVLIDADETLLDFLRSEREAVSEMLGIFGISADEEIIKKYSEINKSLWKALERGEIEKRVLLYHRFELLSEFYGFGLDAKEMAKTYMDILATKGYMLDGALELCKKLQGKVRLYIVTNGVEYIQRGRYKVLGIEKYFDGIFISGLIGYEKPSVEFFNKIVKEIKDFSKDSTLIVGDSLSSDMQGGINFGIDTCWYAPNAERIPDGMSITYHARTHGEIYDIITNS